MSRYPTSTRLHVRRYEPRDRDVLRHLHRHATELGYSTLHLDTTAQQRMAQRLYLKNGYREARRGSIGPFECIFYERDEVA